jgi:hypothetical protein
MKDTFFFFPPKDRWARVPTVYERTPKGMQKVENPIVRGARCISEEVGAS